MPSFHLKVLLSARYFVSDTHPCCSPTCRPDHVQEEYPTQLLIWMFCRVAGSQHSNFPFEFSSCQAWVYLFWLLQHTRCMRNHPSAHKRPAQSQHHSHYYRNHRKSSRRQFVDTSFLLDEDISPITKHASDRQLGTFLLPWLLPQFFGRRSYHVGQDSLWNLSVSWE